MPPNQTTHRISPDFLLDVQAGIIPGHFIINKFGSSLNIDDTGFKVISHGDVYQTPTVPQSLEFVSANAADALNGVGMWEITIEGLDENWDMQEVQVAAHATDGTIAVPIPGTWMRMFRAYVSKSGTYATLSSPSHLGAINILNQVGAVLWATITVTGIPHGQTQIGAFTVPRDHNCYLGESIVYAQTNKPVNVFGFKRTEADTIVAPFSTMRAFTEVVGIEGNSYVARKTWVNDFPEYTDLGFLALGNSPSPVACSIDFELLLIKKTAPTP